MPNVTIDTLVGKTPEQKQQLVDELMVAFEAIGVRRQSVTVVFHDIAFDNFFLGNENMNAYQARRRAEEGGS